MVAKADVDMARPWKRAALLMALLGPLFFTTYGLTNWVASLHASVAEVAFAWEGNIPFIAWTIVPYWSIDLFYGVSLFVFASRNDLDTHACRLLTAQAICVVCFLLWPLQFSWQRPSLDGVFGTLFEVLMGFDKPFNQAPSLHIVLLVILWDCYARIAHGMWSWLLHAWFSLIGLSVLTTYQHHFIDMPTGIAVGWLCVWIWPYREASPWSVAKLSSDPRRRRLAGLYLCGALAFGCAAAWLSGWALWLYWPAASLALVAACYAFFGAAGFQKRANGRLAPASMGLFFPYVIGAWLNSRIWTRSHPAADHISDNVYLGRMPTSAQTLKGAYAAVVDLCAELPFHGQVPHYKSIPMLDMAPLDSASLIHAADAIAKARTHGRVLVCCALGYSRSAAAIAAWLIRSGRAQNHAAALAMVQNARPRIVLSPAHCATLAALQVAPS